MSETQDSCHLLALDHLGENVQRAKDAVADVRDGVDFFADERRRFERLVEER